MRKQLTITLTILCLAMGVAGSASAETTGRGGLFFGTKTLKHSDWGEFDSQPAWGIDLDMKEVSWPVWISVGYLASSDKENVITSASPLTIRRLEAKTSEFRLGVKKDFYPTRMLRVSAAGGPAYIHASLDNTVSPYDNASDSAPGYWAGAEAIVYFKYLSVGVGYHYSSAKVSLFNSSVDAGGSNLAFFFGFGW